MNSIKIYINIYIYITVRQKLPKAIKAFGTILFAIWEIHNRLPYNSLQANKEVLKVTVYLSIMI